MQWLPVNRIPQLWGTASFYLRPFLEVLATFSSNIRIAWQWYGISDSLLSSLLLQQILTGQKFKICFGKMAIDIAVDQPDLVARVYNLKMEAFLDNLRKHHIFSRHMRHCYCIDYQKRGLPHSHLLLFLHEDYHFLDPATIDKIISAEFPSGEADPELYIIITVAMVHGPCGDANPESPCIAQRVRETAKCNKGFPKAFG